MKCSRCGTENPKAKSVCKKCGNFLYSADPSNRVRLTKEQRRQRRVALLKGNLAGCFWTFVVIFGMLIVVALLSFIFVRFLLPSDFFDDMPEEPSTDYAIEYEAKLIIIEPDDMNSQDFPLL